MITGAGRFPGRFDSLMRECMLAIDAEVAAHEAQGLRFADLGVIITDRPATAAVVPLDVMRVLVGDLDERVRAKIATAPADGGCWVVIVADEGVLATTLQRTSAAVGLA